MPHVLALDLATHTGWSADHATEPNRPEWGTVDLTADAGDYGTKGVGLEQFLERRIAHRRPGAISIEQPSDPQFYNAKPEPCGQCRRDIILPGSKRFTNFTTLRTLIGLAFLVATIGKRHGIEVYEVPVQSWRSWFVGSNKGGKEPTFDRCRELGWSPGGFDESDAIGLWCFSKHKLEPSFSFGTRGTPLFGADHAPRG